MSVDACADSLLSAICVTKLSQVVLVAEVEQIDSIIEQTASSKDEL